MIFKYGKEDIQLSGKDLHSYLESRKLIAIVKILVVRYISLMVYTFTLQIIARVVDGSRFQEFKALFGSNIVTGFAHIQG